MIKKEIRVLQVNIQNPHFDGRRKHGEYSVEMFHKGTRFMLDYWDDQCDEEILRGLPNTVTLISGKGIKKRMYVQSKELVGLFLMRSVVVQPDNWEDIETIEAIEPTDVINQLLKDKTISMEQLQGAVKSVLARYDEEIRLEEEGGKQPETAEAGA